MRKLPKNFALLVDDLPTDPEYAIVVFADRVLDWKDLPEQADDKIVIELIKSFVRNHIRRFDLKMPISEYANFGDYWTEQSNYIAKIRSKVEGQAADKLIESVLNDYEKKINDNTFGIAYLNEVEKIHIHQNIKNIRELIESSDLVVRKKNALFRRLSALAEEVDLNGTSTDRFFAFMSDAAFVLGEMAKNAKPFTDEVKDMIKTIGRARSRQEGVSLPPGDETLSLPPPPKPE